MTFNYQLFINSDHSILIEFEGSISNDLLRYISGVAKAIQNNLPAGFVELVPAYNSLLIIFEPLDFQPDTALSHIQSVMSKAQAISTTNSKIIRIPVCYDSRVAEDLDYLADYCGMTVKELIEAHSSKDYTVYMLGFLPGFLYLGGLDERLHCPRRDNPRTKIEAGSVGIGGSQTGIYPVASPGGWQIIGRTPTTMLDIEKSPPSIANPLDIIRFVPITFEEYQNFRESER